MKSLTKYLIPFLVGFGLLSGFFREVTLAYFFGTSRDIEIFRVAYGLPSIWGDSIAISFMSVLTPYILAVEHKEDDSKLASVFYATFILAILVTFIGIVLMPLQAKLFAPGLTGESQKSIIWAGQICWLMFFISVCSIPFRAVMSLRKRLWPAASAQLIKSSFLALSLIIFVLLFKVTDVKAPVFAAIVGSTAMLIMHLTAIGRRTLTSILKGLKQYPKWATLNPILSALFIVFITQIMMSGGRILDRSFASTMQVGTLASIEYSYALLMAMVSFLGASTNIILAPKIGKTIQSTGIISKKYFKAIFGVGVLAVFIGFVVSPLAVFIVKIVFQHGVFDENSLKLTSSIFRIHALALGPLVIVVILNQLFLLLEKQSYLFWICFIKVLLRVASILFFLNFFEDVRALTYALIVSETIIAALQIFLLRRLHLV